LSPKEFCEWFFFLEMSKQKSLPYPPSFPDEEAFISSLLSLITTHELFQVLVGGVHILEFFTHTPDLYSEVLPLDWREWFSKWEMSDVLDLLLREEIDPGSIQDGWRGGPPPPKSLVQYILLIRRHTLSRISLPQLSTKPLSKRVQMGMSPKKLHEVVSFSQYVDTLTERIKQQTGQPITHIVDFGAGQNYLGRALASEPLNHAVVAVEDREVNIHGGQRMDLLANLSLPEATDSSQENQKKKGSVQYLQHRITSDDVSPLLSRIIHSSPPPNLLLISLHSCGTLLHHGLRALRDPQVAAVALVGCCYNLLTSSLSDPKLGFKPPFLRTSHPRLVSCATAEADEAGFPLSQRLRTYIPESTVDGDASSNTDALKGVRLNITALMMACQAPANWTRQTSEAFFTRHFFRALLQRVFLDKGVLSAASSSAPDRNGDTLTQNGEDTEKSVNQAIIIGSLPPRVYTSFPSYARAALTKILSPTKSASPTPLLPPLRSKLEEVQDTMTESELAQYATEWEARRKDLSIVWALMAVSAQVVESVVVVDRWLWLQEYLQEHSKPGNGENETTEGEAFVQAVWDYGLSPRNLVVVGIKGARSKK
jgi:hypothetical protein